MTPWETVADRAMYNTGYLPEHRGRPLEGLRWALAQSATGVELSAHRSHECQALLDAFDDPAFTQLLQAASTVSVHGPSMPDQWVPGTSERLAALPPRVERIVVHPWDGDPAPGMRELGSRLCVENMDTRWPQYASVSGLRRWLDLLPEARVCLDTAHLMLFPDALRRGQAFIDALGERIAQVHTSGIEPPIDHVPMTRAHAEAQWPILQQLTHLPWVLESTMA